jgi:hypothetical protein
VHDVDLRLRKEPMRRFCEEQEADITRVNALGRAANDLHLPAETRKIHRACGFEQIAFHLLQVGLNEPQRKVTYLGIVAETVIERNVRCELKELNFELASRTDG